MRSFCHACGGGLVAGRLVAGPGCLVCRRDYDVASHDAVSLADDARHALRASVGPSAGLRGSDEGEASSADPVVRSAADVRDASGGPDAAQIILSVLADHAWHEAAEVWAAGAAVGVGRRALQRAAKRLGIRLSRTRTVPPRSLWRLVRPAVVEEMPEEPVVEPVVLVEDDGFTVVDRDGRRYAHGPGRQGQMPPASWPGQRFSFETEQF